MSTYTKALLFAVMTAMTATSALARDRDDNPPGPVGGPGTNWENPPGPVGGPGASPDIRGQHQWLKKQMNKAEWRRFQAMKAEQRHKFCDKKRIVKERCWIDRDDNPPGPRGGPGTNWENKPGPKGGPGASPDVRYDRDDNPPGPRGGPGTNWENRPGPQGGPGASPDRR